MHVCVRPNTEQLPLMQHGYMMQGHERTNVANSRMAERVRMDFGSCVAELLCTNVSSSRIVALVIVELGLRLGY